MIFTMYDDVTKEIIKKRRVELICLGIHPKLFYLACKLLDRHITTVYKDGILYQFINEDYPELKLRNKQQENEWDEIDDFFGFNIKINDKRFSFDKAVTLLQVSFGVNKILATNIVTEWRRDKIINAEMYKKLNKYWRYISIPYNTEEEFDI